MEPPVQEPSAPSAWPAATADPEPLLEPPVMWFRFQGLHAGSKGVVQSGPPRANSCIASLPSRMPPASFRRAVVVASSVGTPLDVHTRTRCSADASGVVQVLQGEGDTVHRAAILAAQHLRLRDAGLLQSLVRKQQDERMQAVVSVGDAVQAGAGQFNGRQFSPAHQLSSLMDGKEI